MCAAIRMIKTVNNYVSDQRNGVSRVIDVNHIKGSVYSRQVAMGKKEEIIKSVNFTTFFKDYDKKTKC